MRPVMRRLVLCLVGVNIVLVGLAPTAIDANASGGSLPQRQIAQAFSHLDPLASVPAGRAYLQDFDTPMRVALLQASDRLQAQAEGPGGRTVIIRSTVGRVHLYSANAALVPLTIVVTDKGPPSTFSLTYTAVALRVDGHWQVSWTTMCLLVEMAGTICPAAPKGLEAGAVLPRPSTGAVGAPPLTAGLVDPGPLAMGAGGSLLIADDARNEVLRWQAGVLTVVAADTVAGFAGDGGPATQAELNDPGELAVGPNGTVYVVDSGNNRIRAISVNGTISTVVGDGVAGNTGDGGPATKAEINPSGVAVGPTSILFISSGSDIRVVGADGIISTRVAGGPPYGVDVPIGGVATAFSPGSLALNGQGELVVFSFSPKLLLEVSPAGVVTQVASDYDTALSTAPDGTVLVAEHGPGISRVSGGTETTLFALSRGEVPQLPYGLAPHGVAETGDGTIYADTEPGDGFTDRTGLYSVSPSGVVTVLPVTTPIPSTLPPVGALTFPAGAYPGARPLAGRGTTLTSCPSSKGLESFSPEAIAAARELATGWGPSFSTQLHNSDRSWWPDVVGEYSEFGQEGRGNIRSVGPARRDLYATAVAHACSAALVKESLSVVLGPSPYSAGVEHLFLLDRGGTPLVYFEDF